MADYILLNGDSKEKLDELESESIGAIITDPPYHMEKMAARFGKATDKRAKNPDMDRLSRKFIGQNWEEGKIAFDEEFWAKTLRVLKPGGFLLSFSGVRTYHKMATAIENAGYEIKDMCEWISGTSLVHAHNLEKEVQKILPEGEENNFKGYFSLLRPSHEPICIARKKISENSVAANLLKHNVGALNIEECRTEKGSYPYNTIFSEEASKTLPDFAQSYFYVAKPSTNEKNAGLDGENPHPTVKPINLMRYLIRLVTPKGETILDPFLGSGTTGIAALLEGNDFIGIDLSEEYLQVSEKRIKHWLEKE